MTDEPLRELATDLVSIPSHEDESAAGAFIADWLRERTDASVSVDGAGNVIARRGSGGPSLALVGHHDVVEPATAQVEGDEYRVEERDGRLFGRGTADMKGAVAAMMLAFEAADPEAELVFASFAGEEDGGVGARAAIEDGFAPDYAVVGEGSASYSAEGVLDVAIAHKGRRGSTITASGSSAHASEPEAGENAIYRATDAVGFVRELAPPETTVFDRQVTGSVVVTEIDGGTAWNVIPDQCEVTVDERTVPDSRADLEAVERIEGVSWTVDQDLPPMRCDEEAFADLVVETAAASQPGRPDRIIKPHATDAGWLAAAGTTCVVCGPAEPGEAHTDTESVSLEVLGRAHECYRRLADGWPATVG
jgi:acetylornithine deacetylase